MKFLSFFTAFGYIKKNSRYVMSSTKKQGVLQSLIRSRFETLLTPVFLEIEDESHSHSRGEESHFKVLIVSEIFEGKSLIERHRMVNSAAQGTDNSLPCHALSIQAKTPKQYEAGKTKIQSTPGCLGGEGAKENTTLR